MAQRNGVLVRGADLSTVDVNRLVPYYLMSSYLYYEHDLNVFTDDEFNFICRRLLDEYDDITHTHKYLLDKDNLRASTGYDLKYTNMIKHAALYWYDEVMGKNSSAIGGNNV